MFGLGTEANALERLTAAKTAVQHDLRKVMVRTERLAVDVDRNGMLREVPPADIRLRSDDAASEGLLELNSANGR